MTNPSTRYFALPNTNVMLGLGLLGLVIAEVVPAPQPRRLPDDRGEAGVGLRLRRMTAPFGLIQRPRQVCTPSYPSQKVRSRRSLRSCRPAVACTCVSHRAVGSGGGQLTYLPERVCRHALSKGSRDSVRRWGSRSATHELALPLRVKSERPATVAADAPRQRNFDSLAAVRPGAVFASQCGRVLLSGGEGVSFLKRGCRDIGRGGPW